MVALDLEHAAQTSLAGKTAWMQRMRRVTKQEPYPRKRRRKILPLEIRRTGRGVTAGVLNST